jgi:hypothetical protein
MRSNSTDADLPRFTVVSSAINCRQPRTLENAFCVIKINMMFLNIDLVLLFIPLEVYIVNYDCMYDMSIH